MPKRPSTEEVANTVRMVGSTKLAAELLDHPAMRAAAAIVVLACTGRAQLLAADAGETAVISFRDEVKVRQDFTASPGAVSHALRMLRKEGGGACMLEKRPPPRRRIVIRIAEKRDRASRARLPAVMERVERLNAAIYWLTFSPFLQPFTVKPKTVEDTKPEDERIKMPKCASCPAPDDTAVPPDLYLCSSVANTL